MLQIPGYRLLRRLDRTGINSHVYEAVQADLDRRVAIKVVFDATAGRGDGVLDEARKLAALKSDHVAVVHAFGRGDGFSYLVMEHLDGTDLERHVRERAGRISPPADAQDSTATIRLSRDGDRPALAVEPLGEAAADTASALRTPEWIARAIDLCAQASRGVADLHEWDILHRDVKPANVMVVDDRAKVIDLGVGLHAKDRAASDGEIVGTPDYMSPEQARGLRIDQRSDVYGLGATLYYGLSGRAPFAGVPLAELHAAVGSVEPPPLGSLNPAVPLEVVKIVERAMSKQPGDRYPSAEALAEDLERALAGDSVRGWLELRAMRRRRVLRTALLAVLFGVVSWLVILLRHDPLADLRALAETDLDAAITAARGMLEEERKHLAARTTEHLVGKTLNDVALAAALRSDHGVIAIEDEPDSVWTSARVTDETTLAHVAPSSPDRFRPVETAKYAALPARSVHAIYIASADPERAWGGGYAVTDTSYVRVRELRAAMDVMRVFAPPRSNWPMIRNRINQDRKAKPRRSMLENEALVVLREGDVADRVVTKEPLDQGILATYLHEVRDIVKRDGASAAERLRFHAHPDEPPEFMQQLLGLAAPSGPDDQPLETDSFWLAFRIASFTGGRLIRFDEYLDPAREAKPPDALGAPWAEAWLLHHDPRTSMRAFRRIGRDAPVGRIRGLSDLTYGMKRVMAPGAIFVVVPLIQARR
ncbi:MAG: serine/threonine protein kinase [Planctomycetes bacterium]|nr:serine/threonine protein kinase [Planctomycetota bacterium]